MNVIAGEDNEASGKRTRPVRLRRDDMADHTDTCMHKGTPSGMRYQSKLLGLIPAATLGPMIVGRVVGWVISRQRKRNQTCI